ncbi:alpha/beta-hydrolase [Aspergillus eucalypticola CBS 122712]|uniref:Alpha/beta-hydrolase n=1 Tax=Aspergillus eucalypticola (strain CBS 122712 / IBT 29274) TaxID=1448314 RepID=A0A317UU29_ASPEC|nr:alpha/beta-hydrolase [Aspergillus eucalypticola CBS 122712]PWY64836.1 alpha/beta-hydrolase [Aspergillus eucalypticola CBS 122712]
MHKFRALLAREYTEVGLDATSLDPFSTSLFPDGVEVLHDCPNADYDICFVHGLTGDRRTTWTADHQSAPWPQTLLPSHIRRARILTYGYDAYIVRKSAASSNRLIDHATNLLHDLTADRASCDASSRPLIFVAHSLGGLVCKKAILLSRNDPERHLRGIFNSTRGIIFMGTPHKGAWMADWARISASALGLVKSTNKSLLAVLGTNNQMLESLQVDFLAMVRKLREDGRGLEVTSFFEELPLPVVGKIVCKESATLDGYSSISLHANHRDMVKFGSPKENGYKRLLGEIQRWESRINSCMESSAARTDASANPNLASEVDIPAPERTQSQSSVRGSGSTYLFHNSGRGWINANTGTGTQVNNNGKGNQFNGPVHSLVVAPAHSSNSR